MISSSRCFATSSLNNNNDDPNSAILPPQPIADAPRGPTGATVYPAPFAHVVAGRQKAKLGDLFGLTNFGVNYTTLEPKVVVSNDDDDDDDADSTSSSSSALLHYHKTQDEFVYILEGEATLCQMPVSVDGHNNDNTTTIQTTILRAGDCIGFPAGQPVAHCIRNDSTTQVCRFLEIGDRTAGDRVEYPLADLRAIQDEEGQWNFTHKDGTPYDDDDE